MPLYLKDRLIKAARQLGHTVSHGFPIYPWYFNYDKKDLIDLAFRIATPSPRSFADLGGVWGVNAAYTFYCLDKHEISSAHLVDTNFTPVVQEKSKSYDNLTLVKGNFGDAESVEKVGKVDAVFAPDSGELAGLTEARGKPLDTVIDAVGSPAIINAALPLIKLAGTIGVYGVIADEAITVAKGTGPYNFNLCMHQWPTRARERAAMEPICEWIREGKLSAAEFVTHEFPVEQINDALDAVKRGEVIKALLRY